MDTVPVQWRTYQNIISRKKDADQNSSANTKDEEPYDELKRQVPKAYTQLNSIKVTKCVHFV